LTTSLKVVIIKSWSGDSLSVLLSTNKNLSFSKGTSHMATPAEYFASADINKVPVPDWSHLDVTSPTENPTIRLDWDQVFIDDIDGNVTKEEPHTAAEIEALRLSFAAKVDEKGISSRCKVSR
jgi:hypothetical protein